MAVDVQVLPDPVHLTEEEPFRRLELRNYQKELLDRCIARNTLIYLPTGFEYIDLHASQQQLSNQVPLCYLLLHQARVRLSWR
jgi:hypothetical protein